MRQKLAVTQKAPQTIFLEGYQILGFPLVFLQSGTRGENVAIWHDSRPPNHQYTNTRKELECSKISFFQINVNCQSKLILGENLFIYFYFSQNLLFPHQCPMSFKEIASIPVLLKVQYTVYTECYKNTGFGGITQNTNVGKTTKTSPRERTYFPRSFALLESKIGSLSPEISSIMQFFCTK